jgi:hypothetical protein
MRARPRQLETGRIHVTKRVHMAQYVPGLLDSPELVLSRDAQFSSPRPLDDHGLSEYLTKKCR